MRKMRPLALMPSKELEKKIEFYSLERLSQITLICFVLSWGYDGASPHVIWCIPLLKGEEGLC